MARERKIVPLGEPRKLPKVKKQQPTNFGRVDRTECKTETHTRIEHTRHGIIRHEEKRNR